MSGWMYRYQSRQRRKSLKIPFCVTLIGFSICTLSSTTMITVCIDQPEETDTVISVKEHSITNLYHFPISRQSNLPLLILMLQYCLHSYIALQE